MRLAICLVNNALTLAMTWIVLTLVLLLTTDLIFYVGAVRVGFAGYFLLVFVEFLGWLFWFRGPNPGRTMPLHGNRRLEESMTFAVSLFFFFIAFLFFAMHLCVFEIRLDSLRERLRLTTSHYAAVCEAAPQFFPRGDSSIFGQYSENRIAFPIREYLSDPEKRKLLPDGIKSLPPLVRDYIDWHIADQEREQMLPPIVWYDPHQGFDYPARDNVRISGRILPIRDGLLDRNTARLLPPRLRAYRADQVGTVALISSADDWSFEITIYDVKTESLIVSKRHFCTVFFKSYSSGPIQSSSSDSDYATEAVKLLLKIDEEGVPED